MSILLSLTSLNKDPEFLDIIEKITLGHTMSEDEKIYCLAIAILFIKEYEKDKRKAMYFEFGYFIILSYSLLNDDYEPLYDLSTNFGFYPISKFILEKSLLHNERFLDHFINKRLSLFDNKGITETFEQNRYRNEIIKSDAKDSCYVAPTSFGKSSLMVDLIRALNLGKIAIIVPTKSLLTQTYRLISQTFNGRKVIFHDEMYDNDSNFIAIFTQERALRLLKNEKSLSFDAMLIDEAHSLFELSSRSILLSRLIRKNKKRDSESRFFYFSPLINDENNLRFEENQDIEGRFINFNIKEAEIHEYKLDGKSYIYNRFINKFFNYKPESEMLAYIFEESKSKNFFYLRSPRRVEQFAGMIASKLPVSENSELLELSDIIAKNVHEDFYCVDLVSKGILYIHGKLPDLVKEYLEYKFNKTKSLIFIVANSVIIEGVNLPIDNLFILNTYDMDSKDLINLIGRVNRLNEVFSGDSPSLSKLKPTVHFINSAEFNGAKSNMQNKIETLRSGTFKDEVKNPTLLNFNEERFDEIINTSSNSDAIESAIKEKNNALSIIDRENFLINEQISYEDQLKASFIESGIYSIYQNPDHVISIIFKRINIFINDENWMKLDPIEKVYLFFINGFDSLILDSSFARLKNQKARNYYNSFVRNIHILSLKEHINSTVKYFYTNARDTGNNIFYIGDSYGEVDKENQPFGKKTYIDLSKKTHKELVNLALVKIKMENDFVSYKLTEYVTFLHDINLISDDDYNIFIYGTLKKRNSELTKLGLSGSLINKLEIDDQLKNIEVDKYGNVSVNNDFLYYIYSQDDLFQFEVRKYINI